MKDICFQIVALSIVGKLNYITITSLDISYALRVVSKFLEAPRLTLGRCYSYYSIPEESPRLRVLFRKNGHIKLEGFTNAGWARSSSDRRSTTGYYTFMGGNLVTWKSKKQN